MQDAFREAIRRFETEKAGIDKRQFKHCADMLNTGLATHKVITDSRALICQVDEIMARDILQPSAKAKLK